MLEQISENLIKDRAKEVKELLAGMGTIGEQFKKNEVYVPEVLITAHAMKSWPMVTRRTQLRQLTWPKS